MINSALDPNWQGNSCNMQEYFPNYDEKVFAIRRKIVNGTMKVLQEYWIDFHWNMPPIHYYKTLTHLIYLWRPPSYKESFMVNRYIVSNDKHLATIPWEPPTAPELQKAPVKAKRIRAPRKARNTRKRNLAEFFN